MQVDDLIEKLQGLSPRYEIRISDISPGDVCVNDEKCLVTIHADSNGMDADIGRALNALSYAESELQDVSDDDDMESIIHTVYQAGCAITDAVYELERIARN